MNPLPHHEVHAFIVPTILIPLAAVSVGISAVATYIAGLFGVTLKTEGPKKILEVLIKPRVLITAVFIQLGAMGAWQLFKYIKNYPSFIYTIQKQQSKEAVTSALNYEDRQSGSERHSVISKNTNHFLSSVFEGKVVWQKKLNAQKKLGPFIGGVLSGGSIFYGSDDGYVYELNALNGNTIRKFFVGTMVTPAVAIRSGKLYAGEGSHDTHHARVYQFDLKSGALVKEFQTKGHIEGSLFFHSAANRTLLFVPSGSDGVHALEPEGLTSVWNTIPGHVDSGIEASENAVFIGTGREKENLQKNRPMASAFTFDTGKLIWQHELPASSWMTPLVVGTDVCFPFGEVYFKSELGGISCFNKNTGEPTLTYSQGSPVISELLELESDLVLSDETGKICRVSLKSGRAIWCTQAGNAKKGKAFPKVVYDSNRNLLIYASKSDGLFALEPSTGKIFMHWIPAKNEEEWGTNYASSSVTTDGWIVANDAGLARLIVPVQAPISSQSHGPSETLHPAQTQESIVLKK